MPLDRHEWISFEETHVRRTWVFDATFLRSNWSCIYGSGCKGVLDEDATDLAQGCCSFGAHFVDDQDIQTLVESSGRLKKHHWQYHRQGRRDGVLQVDEEGATTTRVVDGACIFLNRPGFAGGIGCAFHHAALEWGERKMDLQPDVCWQLPLRLEEHVDEHGYVTSTLREWKRRDWGEGGAEFHGWCTEDPDAFVGHERVVDSLEDEIRGLVGDEVYDLLVDHLDDRATGTVFLPHPAVRRPR